MKQKNLKVLGVISLLIAVLAIVSSVYCFIEGMEKTGWIILGASVFSFLLGKLCLKLTRPSAAFHKVFHAMLLVIKYLDLEKLSEQNVKNILFLLDKESESLGKRMFDPYEWKDEDGNRGLSVASFSLKNLNRLKALKAQGVDVTQMVHFLSFSPEEYALILEKLTEYNALNEQQILEKSKQFS